MPRRPFDPRQLDLLPLRQPSGLGAGEGPRFALALRKLLAAVLRDAKRQGLDRATVAAGLSLRLGREISKHMLDRFCAPSADDWRFPLEALPALVQVTGDYRLLEMVAEACGCRLLHGEEAALAEYGARALALKHAKKRMAQLEASMPETLLARLLGEDCK